jgi:hypothetical protein
MQGLGDPFHHLDTGDPFLVPHDIRLIRDCDRPSTGEEIRSWLTPSYLRISVNTAAKLRSWQAALMSSRARSCGETV